MPRGDLGRTAAIAVDRSVASGLHRGMGPATGCSSAGCRRHKPGRNRETTMSELDYLMQQIVKGRINRREFMGRAAALGVGTALMTTMLGEAAKAETPTKGGTLKLGLAGGSTTDSMDMTTWTDSVTLVCGFAMMNGLIENGPDNKPIPELAETYEAKPGAKERIFNIRKGVTFHNGKTLDADDI